MNSETDLIKQLNELESTSNSSLDQLAKKSFWIFFRDIFSVSLKIAEGSFCEGLHFKSWCDEMQNHPKTCIQSARLHGKSTVLRAYIMWELFRFQTYYYEGLYISFKTTMSEYHLEKVNTYIQVNPYFKNYKKLTDAATIVFYETPDGRKFKFEPEGILAFKLGRHPDCVIADDILKDANESLDITQLMKITSIFQREIQSLPKTDGTLHVKGTPKDERDIFFDLSKDKRFYSKKYPAIIDEIKQITLWPDKFPWDELMAIKGSIRKKAFDSEYLCCPTRSTESYFTPEEIKTIINFEKYGYDPKIDNSEKLKNADVRAGYDIGKKRHPSHLAVFKKENNKLVQLVSLFMDEWDYISQINFIKKIIKYFNINLLVYDNTRAELESLFEMGELPSQMVPMTFTVRTKYAMATALEKFVVNKRIELVNDERQNGQLLGVDNDLKSIETLEGHADCYDEQTEILTDQGWKFFKDLDKSEQIATLNKNGYLEYQKPDYYIEKKYKGLMYEVDNTQINLCVTPRHKLYMSNGELRFPKDVFHKQVHYKKNAKWIGKNNDFYKIGEKLIPMDIWIEFLGYYISEGHTTKRIIVNKNKTLREKYQIGIAQNYDKRDKMRECLKKMPYKFTECNLGFWIYSSELAKILYPLGKSLDKYIPEYILEFPTKKLKILFEALMLGDGTKQKTFSCYYTSSKKLAGQIQELLLKIGLSGNIYIRDFIGRKAPHGFTRNLCYQISVITNKNNPIVNKKKNKGILNDRWFDYDGMIYCVNVPNHIVYVKRNGKPCWSGNSFWSLSMCAEAFEQSMLTFSKPVFDEKFLNSKLSKSIKPIILGKLFFNSKTGCVEHEITTESKPNILIYQRPVNELNYRMGVCVPDDLDRPVVACVRELTSEKLVAIYYSRLDAIELSSDLDLVGRYYREAPIAVIANAKGLPVLNQLEKEIVYPELYYDISMDNRNDVQTKKLGFVLNDKSYQYLIESARNRIKDKLLDLPSSYLINSYLSLMQEPTGKVFGKNEEYVLADLLSLFLIDKMPENEMEEFIMSNKSNAVTGY